jgi:hypothetical protein
MAMKRAAADTAAAAALESAVEEGTMTREVAESAVSRLAAAAVQLYGFASSPIHAMSPEDATAAVVAAGMKMAEEVAAGQQLTAGHAAALASAVAGALVVACSAFAAAVAADGEGGTIEPSAVGSSTATSATAESVRNALAQVISADALLEWSGWSRRMASSLGALTQLTHLDLSSWSLGESVTALRPLTRLRSLTLERASQSDFSLCGLLPAMGNLSELSIAGNEEVTRAPLAAVELLLPELSVLDLRACTLIEGDQGFKEWLSKQQGSNPEMTVLTSSSK